MFSEGASLAVYAEILPHLPYHSEPSQSAVATPSKDRVRHRPFADLSFAGGAIPHATRQLQTNPASARSDLHLSRSKFSLEQAEQAAIVQDYAAKTAVRISQDSDRTLNHD